MGLGDSQSGEKEVLTSISGSFKYLTEGVNQIFFLYKDRLADSQLNDYNLIKNVIFGEDITKHITIVRNSPSFDVLDVDNKIECEVDKRTVLKERASGYKIISSSRNFICVNLNPNSDQSLNKSREILLKNLRNFKQVIKLDFDKLTKLVKNYIPENEKLINELENIQKEKKN